MKIGYFSINGSGFVGAVFGEGVFNLSEAASWIRDPVLSELTSLLRQGRFEVTFITELYNREKNHQECWHRLENISFQRRGKTKLVDPISCFQCAYPSLQDFGAYCPRAGRHYFHRDTRGDCTHLPLGRHGG